MYVIYIIYKSHPYPTETAVRLGVQWLPQSGHWHLPLDGQSRIRQMALDLLASPRVTRRQLERIVGLLNFACQVHRFLRPCVQPLTRSNTLVRATERDRPVLEGSPSRQPVGTPGGCVFRPPRPLAPCLHGQRDSSLRPGFVPRPCSASILYHYISHYMYC